MGVLLPQLCLAARRGDATELAGLIGASGELDKRSPCGWTALADAAWSGHLDITEQLIAAGAEVDGQTIDGLSPLMIAAGRGHDDVVAALLRAGAQLEQRSFDSRTALESALRHEHLGVSRQLIGAGAEIDDSLVELYVRKLLEARGCRVVRMLVGSRFGRRMVPTWVVDRSFALSPEDRAPIEAHIQPLGWWALRRRTTLVLRNHPAFVSDPERYVQTESPRVETQDEWANRKGWTEQAQAVLHGEVAPDTPDEHGFLPLLEACRARAAGVVRALLALGADCRIRPSYGYMRGATLLTNVAREGSADLVGLLIEAGADVDTASASGWTPLMAAAVRGHHKSVQALLDAGAEPCLRNAQGHTAMMLAQSRGHARVARLLLIASNQSRAV